MAAGNSIPSELGSANIGTLLKNYAGPAIIAMTATSLYNMVDSIFIGHGIGPLAISGLAVTFPLMNLSAAFGTLVGVGASTMLSVFLGQKNYEAATKILGNEVSLNVIVSLLFMVVALAFLDPILYFFGASPDTIGYARDYMQIILYGNIVTHLYLGMNNLLRASGSPKLAMTLTIFTVLLNTVLDPIFIFWFNMGIRGAAVATVIAQLAALVIIIRFFSDKRRIIHFKKGIFKIDSRIAKGALSIGMSPFLMNAAACIVTLFINQQLKKYSGDLAIGAYGIVNRITFLFIMINMGLNQGMQPIAGYNYGARKYSRVRKVFNKTMIAATVVSTAGFLLSVLMPRVAAGIFTHDEELVGLAAKGLTMMNIMLPIVGFQMIASNLFQCLGMAGKAIIMSMSRQLLFLIPLLYFLPMVTGALGVWLSFPVADFLSALLTLVLLIRLMRKFDRLKDGDEPDILGSTL